MISLLRRIATVVLLYFLSFAANAVTPMVAAGGGASLYLSSDGSVWGTGSIKGFATGTTSPVRMSELPDVVAVAASSTGTHFALQADGTLWAMGDQLLLGDGPTQYRTQAQPVPGLSGVKAIAAHFHALAVKQDGTVWAWGRNESGQLGDGTTIERQVPKQVAGLSNIVQASAAGSNSLALRDDGTVWVWGRIVGGLAGDGVSRGQFDPDILRLVPAQVHIDSVIAIAGGAPEPSLALRADGTVWTWGANPTPAQIAGLDQVVAINSTADGWALALKTDGTLWAWGGNQQGQLGMGGQAFISNWTQVPGLSDIVAISTARWHTTAVRRDGAVFAWGGNDNGELGDGSVQSRWEPRPVVAPGGSGQLNLLEPAPVTYNQLPSAHISTDVTSGPAPLTVKLSASASSDPDGSVQSYSWSTSRGWGWISSDGQQASGPTASFVFAQPGTYQINLLVADNLGGTGYARQQIVVNPVPVTVTATPKLALGGMGIMALANDGRILAWGGGANWLSFYEPYLQQSVSPQGILFPVANGISGAVDFVLYENGGHVLLADGSVVGWGGNVNGAPGVGDALAFAISPPQLLPNLPPVQVLASGMGHGLALTGDGRVFAWGRNDSGQLGLGDRDNRFAPVEVTGIASVIAIAASESFSVALKDDGTVWAWGNVPGVPLGGGTLASTHRPSQIPGLSGIVKIFSTPGSVFAQAADGVVWMTGTLPFTISGDSSGLRRAAIFDGAVQVAGGRWHVIMLKADGTVWTGGQQQSYALGYADGGDTTGLRQVPGIADAIGVAAAGNNSAVLRRDGTVLTWGRNDFGQIGDGTFAIHRTPVAVLNEAADGFLDLIPGTDFELPPSVGVPFFVVASGSVADVKASVSTKTEFNTGDLGKDGAVFVTASVPSGSLVAASSPMSAAAPSDASAASKPASSAATATSSFVLVNLTSSGWQPVTNGQVSAYATGVLGDQLAAQTILSNTDTTNLKGAHFCLGYGASAAQMIASGTMRVVASIPDPNASGATAPTCILAGPPVSYSLALQQGWSLLGNSLNQSLTVASLFNDVNAIVSVWKWDANTLGWQFYTPLMDATALQTYAASKGYAVLNTINPGEGYWVNAKAQPTIGTQSGDSFILTGMNLAKGWNLVATGNDITPAEFNASLKASAVPASLTTLWAWDNLSSKWFFYAPSLEAQGGTALSGYIANKGYLDFATTNKKLSNGTGFWVNR